MSTAPLPNQIDIRKLVVKGAEISVQTPISTLPRIVDLLANDDGSIAVNLQFYIDEGRFRRVDGHLMGTVDVICQRCLEPMPVAIDTRFELGIVWSEKDAERLPKSLDPLIVGEELMDLGDVVSEELILCLPYVNYHDSADCQQQVGYSSVDPDAIVDEAITVGQKGANRDSPFNVLKKLKSNKKFTQ
ncbi:MAG: YceD family protein [Pseudomonadales bacterium]